MRVVFFGVASLASGQTPQCNPLPQTQAGIEIIGTITQVLSESSAEMCCYYSGRAFGKAWTFIAEGGDTCAKQTVFKGIAFDASGSGTHVVQKDSSDDCCGFAVASGRPAWTYDESSKSCTLFYSVRGRRQDSNSTSGMGSIPGLDKCSEQTRFDGVEFDWTSSIPSVKANSSAECCSVAQEKMRSLWSFNKRTKDCTVFYELRGRHLNPDVVSAMGGTPFLGTCKIFSAVSGTKSNPRAMSSANASNFLSMALL